MAHVFHVIEVSTMHLPIRRYSTVLSKKRTKGTVKIELPVQDEKLHSVWAACWSSYLGKWLVLVLLSSSFPFLSLEVELLAYKLLWAKLAWDHEEYF